ncbi:MAG: flagellar motor switch protein FliG [Candidatus Latescibacterota bacterium]
MQYKTHRKEDLRREEEGDLSPAQKAAIIMVSLGEDCAGELMKFLSDVEIEDLTQIITELKSLPRQVQTSALEEFEQHLLAGEYVNRGGVDFARAALERAVGPRKAQDILDRVMTNVSSGFYMLRNVAPAQIAPFISNEHPQTVALILSQLEPTQAAGILAQLPERLQAEVAYRIATLDNITPMVLKQIEESLQTNLKDLLGGNQDVGGPKVVADMLNLTGGSVEKSILDRLDAQDPEVAEEVRNLMFVFDDIQRLTDREIQTLLREVEQKDLVIALKAASEEVKGKILSNMSERVRSFIEEEMEYLGPMRLSEVEEVQLRVVQKVRQLEEQGQINIVRGGGKDTFV